MVLRDPSSVPNPENFTRGYMLARVSHEKVRAVHHNPHLGDDLGKFRGP